MSLRLCKNLFDANLPSWDEMMKTRYNHLNPEYGMNAHYGYDYKDNTTKKSNCIIKYILTSLAHGFGWITSFQVENHVQKLSLQKGTIRIVWSFSSAL